MKVAWILAVALALAPVAASADQRDFCSGFSAGWKAAFQNRGRLVALTPLCPLAPLGQDSFQGGYEAGLLRALSEMGG